MTTVTIQNKKVDAGTFTQYDDLSWITELVLIDCDTDTSALWPTLPNLKKIKLEYCRGEQQFSLSKQPHVTEVNLYRCNFTTVDLTALTTQLPRLYIKQCRTLMYLKGLDEINVANLVVTRCPNLIFPLTKPSLSIETLGWREMLIDGLPVELFPKLKWLDLTGSQLTDDPDLNALPELRSLRLQFTKRSNPKPFVVPKHVPNIVADKDHSITFDMQYSRIVIPAEGTTTSGEPAVYNRPGSIRHAKRGHPASLNRRGERIYDRPKVDTQPELFTEQTPVALFPEKYANSEIHQAYVEKVKAQAWHEFTEAEFAHFLSAGPEHALVRLGVVTRYKVVKRVMGIAKEIISKRPELAKVKASVFKL